MTAGKFNASPLYLPTGGIAPPNPQKQGTTQNFARII